jgi:hypothetical protein
MTHQRTSPPAASQPARPKVVLEIILLGILCTLIPILFAHWVGSPARRVPIATQQAEPAKDAGGAQHPDPAGLPPRTVEDQWGVRISGLRLALGGAALDLRYIVVDAGKATNLFSLQRGPFLIDENKGKTLEVPFQRENQTSQKLVAGKTCFALLPNKGQVVSSGDKITVVIGNTRQRDLVVE